MPTVKRSAHDRKRREQLCRYITRPALYFGRLRLNDAGQVKLKREKPWRDGTAQLIMSPLQYMQRLAALVPRPRLQLIRLHGMRCIQRKAAGAGGAEVGRGPLIVS